MATVRKTVGELMDEFYTKYPASECVENPLVAVEGIGYLKCLATLHPACKKIADETMVCLMLTVATTVLSEDEV